MVDRDNRVVGRWEQVLTIIQAHSRRRQEVRINIVVVRTGEQFPRPQMITNNMPELKSNSRTWSRNKTINNRGELNLLTPKAQGTSPRPRCAPDAWPFWETENANDATSSTAKTSTRSATIETANPKKSRAFKSNNTQPLAKPTNQDNRQTKAKNKHKVESSNIISQDSNPKYQNLKMTNMKEEVTITNV